VLNFRLESQRIGGSSLVSGVSGVVFVFTGKKRQETLLHVVSPPRYTNGYQ